MNRKIIIYISLYTLSSLHIIAQSPYTLSWGKDAAIVGIGSILLGWGIYEDGKLAGLSADEIIQLDPSQVNSFDRGATASWQPDYSAASDVLVISSLLLPGALLLDDLIYQDATVIAAIYSETMILTNALVLIAKGRASRLRPYAYNKDVDFAVKRQPDARKSFFSGHVAVAFASTIFAATVYDDYFPGSKWSKYIWTGAITISAAVASLRVAAGKHYITDVLAGAAAGSLAGYLIPFLHKQNSNLSVYPSFNVKNKYNIYGTYKECETCILLRYKF